jgi:spore coat protein U-like protein
MRPSPPGRHDRELNVTWDITGRPARPPRDGRARRAASRHPALRWLGPISLLSASFVASAGTSTTTFTVSATVVATCQISAAALNFGPYTPGSGATLHVNTTISVQCTSGTTAPTLALNAGSSGGTMANRLMAGPSRTNLQYNLYTSNTYATVFGDGTGGSSTVPVTIGGNSFLTPVQVTVYGQLVDSAANQGAATPGIYTDTVTATLTY